MRVIDFDFEATGGKPMTSPMASSLNSQVTNPLLNSNQLSPRDERDIRAGK